MSQSRKSLAALLLAASTVLLAQPALAQSDAPKPGAESLERFKASIQNASPALTPEGYQKGNLKEHGAKELLSNRNYESALKASTESPVLIFKHSTQCPVSAAAYERLGAWLEKQGNKAPPVYLVKVIERKPVSKEIEANQKVKHESPQILLIDNKKTVWHTSHEKIDAPAIDKALRNLKSKS